jgi:hypothetical protein
MSMILVSRSAAVQIFAEVRRWVEQGLISGGAPLESIIYPLSALVPSGPLRCPLELVDLDDISEMVIDAAAIPPDSVKAFSAANCHFAATDLEQANRRFNATIDALLERRPRLGVLSKLHAHPFAGGAFLSAGDLQYGVYAPEAVAWRLRRGLSTALLHVVYPDGEPAIGERPWRVTIEGATSRGRGGRQITWRIRSWGLESGGGMRELGDARVVPERHPTARASRRKPYWTTRNGGRWCDGQKHALRDAGYRVSRNLLGRGWRRYLLSTTGERHLVIALPPDLPSVPPRVLEVIDATEDRFEPLPLPFGWVDRRSLSGLSLVELARHYLGR